MKPSLATPRRICLLHALAAALALLCWQAATVHFNYGGNWTALFMTGDTRVTPPELASETYHFQGSAGYDGQFYRYMAHAPWYRADWSRSFDNPRLRYRRILMPVLAWLLAAGQGQAVDPVYIGLILCWVFMGVYWLGLYALDEGRHPAWGWAFLLLPSTLTSIDRMTVDVALAALCVAFVLNAKQQRWPLIYLVLALAGLLRETGLLLIAAQCCYELAKRNWRRAALFTTAALPAGAWYLYVWAHLPAVVAKHPARFLIVPHWLFEYPVIGIFIKLFQPAAYPFGPRLNLALQCADALALCGLLMVLAMALWSLRRRPWDLPQWATLCFLVLWLATSVPSFWGNVYSYARPFSPLIFFATLVPLRNRARWTLIPVSLMTLRIAIQLVPQGVGILEALR